MVVIYLVHALTYALDSDCSNTYFATSMPDGRSCYTSFSQEGRILLQYVMSRPRSVAHRSDTGALMYYICSSIGVPCTYPYKPYEYTSRLAGSALVATLLPWTTE